jgi:hypothetical protein
MRRWGSGLDISRLLGARFKPHAGRQGVRKQSFAISQRARQRAELASTSIADFDQAGSLDEVVDA